MSKKKTNVLPLTDPMHDWRGVELQVGDTVVWPSYVGQKSTLNEGWITELCWVEPTWTKTPLARVRLHVERRQGSTGSMVNVMVDADKVTVVELPPTEKESTVEAQIRLSTYWVEDYTAKLTNQFLDPHLRTWYEEYLKKHQSKLDRLTKELS